MTRSRVCLFYSLEGQVDDVWCLFEAGRTLGGDFWLVWTNFCATVCLCVFLVLPVIASWSTHETCFFSLRTSFTMQDSGKSKEAKTTPRQVLQYRVNKPPGVKNVVKHDCHSQNHAKPLQYVSSIWALDNLPYLSQNLFHRTCWRFSYQGHCIL